MDSSKTRLAFSPFRLCAMQKRCKYVGIFICRQHLISQRQARPGPIASSRLQGHTLTDLLARATTYLYWSPALLNRNLIFSALLCGQSSRRYGYAATCSTSVHIQLLRLNVRHVLPYFPLLFLLNSSFWLFSCTNMESNSSPDQRVFNYFCNVPDGTSEFSFILPISSSFAVPLDISPEHV